jgi:creatinine amidohydrolase
MLNLNQQNKQFNLTTATYNETKGFKYDYAVLPWGSTEPHNFHLPYLTDSYITHDLALEAVAKVYEQSNIKGMVLPPMNMGSQSPMMRELPFSIHTRYETQKAILKDIVASLDFQGIDVLVILNGHGGNNFKNMIRDLAVDYPDFILVSCDWYSILSNGEITDARGEIHSGEMETSIMMYYHPDLVDISVAKEIVHKNNKRRMLQEGLPWLPSEPKSNINAELSNPQNATEEKGKEYAEAVTEKLATLFTELTGIDNF